MVWMGPSYDAGQEPQGQGPPSSYGYPGYPTGHYGGVPAYGSGDSGGRRWLVVLAILLAISMATNLVLAVVLLGR